MDRFGVGGRSVFSGSGSVFFASAAIAGDSFVGVIAPHNIKLNVAMRHCSMMYGSADSRKLPIICLEINKPANCCGTNYQLPSRSIHISTINYFFQLLLVAQIESDVEQRQKGVDELEQRHFADQMVVVLRLLPIVL